MSPEDEDKYVITVRFTRSLAEDKEALEESKTPFPVSEERMELLYQFKRELQEAYDCGHLDGTFELGTANFPNAHVNPGPMRGGTGYASTPQSVFTIPFKQKVIESRTATVRADSLQEAYDIFNEAVKANRTDARVSINEAEGIEETGEVELEPQGVLREDLRAEEEKKQPPMKLYRADGLFIFRDGFNGLEVMARTPEQARELAKEEVARTKVTTPAGDVLYAVDIDVQSVSEVKEETETRKK